MNHSLNIIHCSICGYPLIKEESSTHKCKRVIYYRIDNDILWLNDGERWYPYKEIIEKN